MKDLALARLSLSDPERSNDTQGSNKDDEWHSGSILYFKKYIPKSIKALLTYSLLREDGDIPAEVVLCPLFVVVL